MITIRPAAEADVPALRQIAVAAYEQYVPLIGREPAPMTAEYAAAVQAGQAWVAAEAEASVQGFIVLVPQPGYLLLENVAVVPAAQGRGLGARLLAFAEEQAAILRLPEIRLYTNEAMTANLAYYPRHGYTETHRAQEDGFRRVFFRKRLDAGVGTFGAMTIEPDTKDWTWVLQRPCPECGLDTQSFGRDEIGAMVRANAASWHGLLTAPGDPRRRPSPGKWSPLEYACHVRDVLRLYEERLMLMLTEDGPLFANWDQDVTAIEDDYAGQDPAVVASELTAAAGVIAAHFDSVAGDQWQRTGSRSDGARFTVESFARYFVHDPIHHLHDVTGTR